MQAIQVMCLECDAHFRPDVDDDTNDIECPECGSTDIDLEY